MSQENNNVQGMPNPEKNGFVANYIPGNKKEWVSFVEGVGVSILVGGVIMVVNKLREPKGPTTPQA